MKLIMCKKCADVYSLELLNEKHCKCGETMGMYVDELNAVYSGDYAIPIGFSNSGLNLAIALQPKTGEGFEFTAFTIPKYCETFKKL